MNIQALEDIFKQCIETAKKKNADYGGSLDNIAMTGAHGIAVRLVDKVARVHNLTQPNKINQVKDESVKDTFLDMVNYAAYGIMLLEGTWDGEQEETIEQKAVQAGLEAQCPECGAIEPKQIASNRMKCRHCGATY